MSMDREMNPFVGLRPFESDESLLFFGRQEQVLELLERLHNNHFVGVVGPSGSGKSSLIRAGLIPKLKAGYLVDERDQWVFSIFKPGESPIYNFVKSILGSLKIDVFNDAIEKLVEKIKEEGTSAILELFEETLKNKRINIFVLVDQFEELFRFSIETNDKAKKEEAAEFVNILIELSHFKKLPFYIVITMRSDFTGDCTQFFGLPEALNKSQYLVPRLTRSQLKTVIEGPIRLSKGNINPALTVRILNDLQNVKDELPLLQHTLMRTWDYEVQTNKNNELDLHDYEAIGGIANALSLHADEAMLGMSEEEKRIAEIMFKALTGIDDKERKIRRPSYMSEIISLTRASATAVEKVIDHFNIEKRNFLVINKREDKSDPFVDISHESLIRQWQTLIVWVEEEIEASKTYLNLSDSAKLYKAEKKDLFKGTELEVALSWQKENKPNEIWASRYSSQFAQAITFLEDSFEKAEIEKKQKEEAHQTVLLAAHQRKLLRRTVSLMTFIIIFLVGFIFFIFRYNEQKQKTYKAIKVNTTALDSIYAIHNQIDDTCWNKLSASMKVLLDGNPEYKIAILDELNKLNPNNNGASIQDTTGQDLSSINNNIIHQAPPSDTKPSPANLPTEPTKPVPTENTVPERPVIYYSLNVKPEYPGGKSAMIDFLSKNLEYPESASENQTGGRVVIQVIISETGIISDAKVIGERNDPRLEAEAIRLVNLMPRWKPGENDGKPVKCIWKILISFKP